MKIPFNYFFIAFIILFVTACNHSENAVVNESSEGKQQTLVTNDVQTKAQGIEEESARFNAAANRADAKGIIGVFDVPEMLAMVILDSAKLEDVAARRAENYAAIEKEMAAIGAEMDGSPGSIYYNNDPKNFKFECLILIHEMPKITPKKCQLVVLESGNMLIYNHVGAYQNLNKAYDAIKAYCEEEKLQQIGPMREFYIVNGLDIKDDQRWLTRIMVPVMKQK